MNLAEYSAYDGLGLAALIQRGETTPREIGRCVLSGIAAVNPRLNAVIETYDDAVAALGERAGAAPFHGLPTLTKDFPVEAGRIGYINSQIVSPAGYRSFNSRLGNNGCTPVSPAEDQPADSQGRDFRTA